MSIPANSAKPTAANILSSLGIKGAIASIPEGETGSSYAGFVPVLDENGRINVQFIPSSAVEASISPLGNVFIVDPNSSATEETGSVIAPFKTINAAAKALVADLSGRCALVLMPGFYSATDPNSIAEFSKDHPDVDLPTEVFIIGLGECVLGSSTFSITGLATNGTVVLQNIVASSNIQADGAMTVLCLGRTYISGTLMAEDGATISISSESRITSISPETATLSYLSDASRIGNGSSVPGSTVKDALSYLNNRRIRLADVSFSDESGFIFDNDVYTDVAANGENLYDLRQRQKVFVDGINRLMRLGDDIVVNSVTAEKVTAKLIETEKLKMNSLVLGGYQLTIDPYGYLVVAGADTPIVPPSGVILISDSAPGNSTVYALYVYNGRMHIENADTLDSSGSSDPTEVVTEFTLVDSKTGTEYIVRVVNGRITIDGGDSGDSGDSVV